MLIEENPLEKYISYVNPKILKVHWVEIGFGNGEFIINLAKENPNKILFGIEVSDNSVRKLINKMKYNKITNIWFSKIDAFWGFQLFFEDGSIERIYINYPCPWFKKRHFRRRITRREVLLVFFKKLKFGGEVVIRTDWFDFVRYTQEQAQDLFDVSAKKLPVSSPITKYERKWISQGRDIYEIVFKKVKELKKEPDEFKTIEISSEVMSRTIHKVKDIAEIYDFLCSLRGKQFYLQKDTICRIINPYLGEGKLVAEAIISENTFVQRFFISVSEKEDFYIVDVSEFSEVLRTRGILKFVEHIADLILKYQKNTTDSK